MLHHRGLLLKQGIKAFDTCETAFYLPMSSDILRPLHEKGFKVHNCVSILIAKREGRGEN